MIPLSAAFSPHYLGVGLRTIYRYEYYDHGPSSSSASSKCFHSSYYLTSLHPYIKVPYNLQHPHRHRRDINWSRDQSFVDLRAKKCDRISPTQQPAEQPPEYVTIVFPLSPEKSSEWAPRPSFTPTPTERFFSLSSAERPKRNSPVLLKLEKAPDFW